MHCQKVGNSASRITKFTRHQPIYNSSSDRQRHYFPATDLPRLVVFCFAPVVKKVLSALLMKDIKQCATRDQEDHDDDVRLNEDGRYGRRKFGERIAGKH